MPNTCVHKTRYRSRSKNRRRLKEATMATRKWDQVRAGLTAGREEEVRAAEEQLRAEVRAYRLAEVRKTRHLTQQQVADEMGVTTARVSQIEHGQVDRAAIRGLAGYVEALGGHLELVADFGDERIVIGLQDLAGVLSRRGGLARGELARKGAPRSDSTTGGIAVCGAAEKLLMDRGVRLPLALEAELRNMGLT